MHFRNDRTAARISRNQRNPDRHRKVSPSLPGPESPIFHNKEINVKSIWSLPLYCLLLSAPPYTSLHAKGIDSTALSGILSFLLDDTGTAKEEIDDNATEIGNVQNLARRTATMVQEYHLVMNLVKTVTDETVDSGDWSDPSIWKSGKVPGDGARVLIHANHVVTVGSELDSNIRTILVRGELAFNPHRNTALKADTIVTTANSVLRIGEPGQPVDADKKAVITVSDYGNLGMVTDDPASPDYDPLRIGQGILTNGLFLAHGSYKTPYVAIAGNGVAHGSSTVELDEEVEGWAPGDEVLVLGTSASGTQSELRKIAGIDGKTVTLDNSLDYNHIVPETTIEGLELKVHIANLTRNIVIRSDASLLQGDRNDMENNVEHRGHVLFMHNNNVNINGVLFKDLGRTNKKYRLDETRFDSEDLNASATHIGTNQAARYPVHFHRAGHDGKLGRITGCVVFSSPGWGYVNHSSNVIMKQNIAYRVYGSSFITEAGDENGKFIENMAVETRGVGRSSVKGWKARESIGDWGFGGNGFWLLGPNVDIVGNIVNGSSNSAYAFTRTTIDHVTGVIDSETQKEKKYGKVALKSFVNNIAYANSGGVFGILSGTRDGTNEVITGLTAYANGPLSMESDAPGEMISWWYPSNVTLEGVTLVGDIRDPQYTGIGTSTKLRKTVIRNARIEGFEIGLYIPTYIGPNLVENGYFNNLVNLYYMHGTTNKGANTTVRGDIRYGTLPGDVNQVTLKTKLNVRDVSFKNYWDRQFLRFNVIYAPEGETPMKIYLTREQAADYVIEVGDDEYKGKTNQWRIDNGKAPVGGVLVPDDAVVLDGAENVSVTPAE